MKILSMSATFGKLDNQSLLLQDGLHIINAPNEWGKSTWCAFMLAMLYGIDTRERTKAGALADKERYAPWNGSAMSGRMDILWNGKHITLERSSKGRNIMGVFRAYETDTGIEIPELTAENCGQMLLGVEKEVYKRSGFLRLSEMPVTQDESLRSRLNALVTTGDESGTADTLGETLRELRNKVRSNRSNGLLPQAEEQCAQLEQDLSTLQTLQEQCSRLQERQQQLQQQQEKLSNHADALAYAQSLAANEKYAAAKEAVIAAQAKADALVEACKALPDSDTIYAQQAKLWQLRERRENLHTQQPPREPQPYQPLPCFRDMDPDTALRCAQTDHAVYTEAVLESRKWLTGILGICLAAAGLICLLIPNWIGKTAGAAAILAGIALFAMNNASRKRSARTVVDIAAKYAPLPPEQWLCAAQNHLQSQTDFKSRLAQYEQALGDYNRQRQTLEEDIHAFTGGTSLTAAEQLLSQQLNARSDIEDAQREVESAQRTLAFLEGTCKQASPPRMADSLTYSAEETQQALASCALDREQLKQQLGLCMGRMEKLGDRAAMEKQLTQVRSRIERLNLTLDALNLAQDTLTQATAELQRRFAPRISQRALEFFQKMTAGRYDRLTLGADFTVHAGAQNESVLHEALWRSEGTVDQLYLALRLAVAEALTPNAPLILDDALVRFDDQRLRAAMELLQTISKDRQVILFTCQSREKALCDK